MASYRYRTSTILGPWRPSREDALQDALRAGQCRVDEAAAEGQVWMVPGEIEEDADRRAA